MAEQFILPNATSKLVKNFLKTVSGCTITNLAHATIGWNPRSRAANGMMGLGNAAPIVNRNGLPPHFYIEIASGTVVSNTGDTDLVRVLSRGVVPTVLKALDSTTSAPKWNEGRYFEALNRELEKGNVSICIYHLDGTEVTQNERDKVNGFPKA